MKFNKSIIIALILAIAIACTPKRIEQSPLGALLASQISGLGQGNCAISINHAGLSYGAVYAVAINTGLAALISGNTGFDSAFAGVFNSIAANNNITTFTQAQYESATGSTVAAQGYANYASVPYSVKYDAFFANSGTWTTDRANALLGFTRTILQSFNPYPLLTNNNTGGTNGVAGPQLTGLTGIAATFQDSFLNTTSTGSISNRTAAVAAFNAGLFPTAGSFLVAYQTIGTFQQISGTAALACARIPRQSCNVAGLTTATRAADILAITNNYNTVVSNRDCPTNTPNFNLLLAKAAFRGLAPGVTVTGLIGPFSTFANTTTNVGSTLQFNSSTSVLGQQAYPKFGSLINLGFGVLMPINRNSSTAAYPTATSSGSPLAFYGGANMDARVVDNCDSLTMGLGPTPQATTPQPLVTVQENAYNFSTSGSAAGLYSLFSSSTSIDSGANITNATPPPSGSSTNCSLSLRRSFAVPVAIGGGRLPDSAPTGTQLLSICVYGGNATTRNFPKAFLSSGLTAAGISVGANQIPDCTAAAAPFSKLFAETQPTATPNPAVSYPNTTN